MENQKKLKALGSLVTHGSTVFESGDNVIIVPRFKSAVIEASLVKKGDEWFLGSYRSHMVLNKSKSHAQMATAI